MLVNTRRRQLPLAATALAIALAALGCGVPGIGSASARTGGMNAAGTDHREIPLSAGTPSMGQQPRLPRDPALAGSAAMNLLYTNDIHSRVDPFPADFYNPKYAGRGGFARLTTAIRAEKAANPATIAVDSGDYLQGTPYFNFYRGEAEMKLMSTAGFDAVTIGNHEFDNGVAGLMKVLPLYRGTLITTNMTFGADVGQRYSVKKVGHVRVGMFALITEVNGLIASPNFRGARYYDPIASAKAVVAKLKDEADVIVMLSHVGSKLEPKAGGGGGAGGTQEAEAHDHDDAPLTDEDVAAAVPGIDVIVSGHSHVQIDPPRAVGNPKDPTFLVSTGMGGAFLGKLRITFENGKLAKLNNTLVPMDASVPMDRSAETIIAPYRAPMAKTLARVVGEATTTFYKYRPEDAECGINNLVADAMLYGARQVDPAVEFAIASSGTPRAALNAGPISVEDVFYALPFDNEIVIQEVSGEVVKAMLTLQRRPQDYIRHAVANASYLLTKNAGAITDITIAGKPLDPNKRYKVAVNDYMAEGSSGFTMLTDATRRNTKVLQRDAMIKFIEANRRLAPSLGRIRLTDAARAPKK